MLRLLMLLSHDETCAGRRSLLFRGDLSSALLDDVMHIRSYDRPEFQTKRISSVKSECDRIKNTLFLLLMPRGIRTWTVVVVGLVLEFAYFCYFSYKGIPSFFFPLGKIGLGAVIFTEKLFYKKHFKDVSREIDEFEVNTSCSVCVYLRIKYAECSGSPTIEKETACEIELLLW